MRSVYSGMREGKRTWGDKEETRGELPRSLDAPICWLGDESSLLLTVDVGGRGQCRLASS
jgi:hypothetical protein